MFYQIYYGETAFTYIVLDLKLAEFDEFWVEKVLLLLIRITVFSSGSSSYIVFKF